MAKLDKETSAISQEALLLKSLIEHEAWALARQKLIDKVMDLQNAFNIDDKNPQEMLIDLKARKVATLIITEWLRKDIEGAVEQLETNLPNVKHSHIIREE